MSDPSTASSSSAASAESSGAKLFVGNLSFNVTEADLSAAFGVYGTVLSSNIITRGPRSLGYGFIELASLAEAQAAVAALNKQELDGRPINLEIAKVRDPNAIAAPREPTRSRRANRSARAASAAPQQQQEDAAAPSTRAPRARRAPRSRSERAPQAEGSSSSDVAAPRQPRQRTPTQYQEQREQRQQRPRVESDTTLFVANLPFSVDDDGLAAIFDGLKVTKAHIVRKSKGHSKGFGFVEFANKEDQLAALQAKDKADVEGRELSVKVALTLVADAAAVATDAAVAAN